MALYVYKDEERTKELYAKNAHKEDKAVRFYCPNPNCNAHMYICGLDGSASIYFGATYIKYPHVEGCIFGKSNSFEPSKYDEISFDFEKAIESMLVSNMPSTKSNASSPSNSEDSNKKTLRTLRQIYDMCKSHKCSDAYNNIKIGRMLLDDRSIYMYPKGIFGYKLIEAKIIPKEYFYDNDTQTVTLYTPIKDEKYKLHLKFNDKRLFKIMVDKLYNNRDKTVVVSGIWKATKTFNVFYSNISSKKQYCVIK